MAQDAPIIMDGKCDAVYGNPKSSQVVHTGFGNATDGVNSYANGSELDAAYFKIDSANGYLYMCMPGNLESNFNKLDIFIDSVPGEGQNEIRSDNPDIDYNGLNKMGRDDVNGYAGLKFDTGFAADFCLMTTLGGDPVTQYANIAQVLTNGGGVGAYIGSGIFSGPTGVNLLDDQVYGCQLSISNANTAGVSGDSANPGSGCGVVTGIEMKIPLGLLAWDGASDIKICAFINGPDHDFVSNQVLGSLPIGSNNLGGDGTGGHLGGFPGALRGVNFATIPGDQYLSVFGADACGLCFGDLDASGEVDSGDVALALLDSGICSDCAADLDGSGEVDSGDVALLLLSAGACQ
ncbi:MAG: hypothetical protein EXS12_06695 [Phycisphaerales bacterium]|nr:hypothetical protein [Phycisphaerales bacterium]